MSAFSLVRSQATARLRNQAGDAAFRRLVTRLLFLGALFAFGSASSSSVLQMSFDELCQTAELIVDGSVVAVTTEQDATTPFIWTRVTVSVNEVVVGANAPRTVELVFLGGALGERRLHVANMRVPILGERGVYFVETLGRRQVHPLLGWQQGHFTIQRGTDQRDRVYTAARRPIRGIAIGQVAGKNIARGEAAGVLTQVGGAGDSDGMALEEFKSSIRAVLDQRHGAPQ